MSHLAPLFTHASLTHLSEDYLSRIRQCLEVLDPESLWRRPGPEVVSVGNLLLHLEGNVRQWILAGVAGQPDARERQEEFAAAAGDDGATLYRRLEATVREAATVIDRLSERELLEERQIQGFTTTVLGAVYHVVEHFSWHCGQITMLTKLSSPHGHQIRFYDDDALNRASVETLGGS